MNQEYTLRFDVTLDNGETYYYYTRLLQRAGTNISEYLEFADSFYQTCLIPRMHPRWQLIWNRMRHRPTAPMRI